MSAPAFTPHRVVLASPMSRVFRAQADSREMVAPFSMTMKPKAESSTVIFSESQSPQALPDSFWSPSFLNTLPTTILGL